MGGRVESDAARGQRPISPRCAAPTCVLFCVKSTDTDAGGARRSRRMLKADALVLSLQNGVDNAATIARHVRQTVVPAVVYVATAMPEPGVVRHHGRGDLVIGALDAAAAQDAARRQRACDGGPSCSRRPECRCASRPT